MLIRGTLFDSFPGTQLRSGHCRCSEAWKAAGDDVAGLPRPNPPNQTGRTIGLGLSPEQSRMGDQLVLERSADELLSQEGTRGHVMYGIVRNT